MGSNKLDLAKVVSALNSSTRRKILSVLEKDHMTLQEIFEKLNKEGVEVKYRESVYRALQKLVNAGLIEKFYEKQKGICYKLVMRKIEIDLIDGKVSIKEK
jgi:Fe2+ or Zn2+ uptake regulation protein